MWEAGGDPDLGDSIAFYRVYLALDSNFTTELDSQEVFGTELLWTSLQDDQTYWWRVKAFDTHGNGTFSNQKWNFHTYFCESPFAFSLIEPADSSHLLAGDIDFCWQTAHDPDPNDHVTYTVYMETSDTSFSYETDSDTCISIDISTLGLSDSVLVEWWVGAHSICPDTIVQSLTHFHFYPPSEHPPLAFNLISPAWGDTSWTLSALLAWEEALDSDIGDTVSYEVFLDTLSGLSTAWETGSGLSDTSFTLEELLDDHTYYWTVHASDLNTSGTWANDTSMFRTYYPETPSDFALLEPEDNLQLPFGDVDFCWQTSHEPDPGDIVIYTMYFQSSDTSLTISIGTDTCHTLDVGTLGLTDSLVVEWWIEAHSSYPDTSIESTTHFHFYPPSAAENEEALIPKEFALHQNWPNPFNPTTQICFDLKESGFVSLKVYNLMGQEITSLISSIKTAGTHTVTFNANNLPTGIYIYRLEVKDFISQKKMLLLK